MVTRFLLLPLLITSVSFLIRNLRDVITVQPSRSTRSSIALVTSSSPTICRLRSPDHKPLLPVCLTCGTSFFLLFVFFVSSVLYHLPPLLCRHTQILDCLSTFFVAFSTLVLKLAFSQSLSLHNLAV